MIQSLKTKQLLILWYFSWDAFVAIYHLIFGWQIDCVEAGDDEFDKSDDDEHLKFPSSEIGRW